jgi:hypothetical protein
MLSYQASARLPLPAPVWPRLPNLDASVQLVVGPKGASSQGTIAFLPSDDYVIITHDHFSHPRLDERDHLNFKENGHRYFSGRVDFLLKQPDASRYGEVNIIYKPGIHS